MSVLEVDCMPPAVNIHEIFRISRSHINGNTAEAKDGVQLISSLSILLNEEETSGNAKVRVQKTYKALSRKTRKDLHSRLYGI